MLLSLGGYKWFDIPKVASKAVDDNIELAIIKEIAKDGKKPLVDYITQIEQVHEKATKLNEKLGQTEADLIKKFERDTPSSEDRLKAAQAQSRQPSAQPVNEDKIVRNVVNELLAHHKDQLKGEPGKDGKDGKDADNDGIASQLLSNNDFISNIQNSQGTQAIDKKSLDNLANNPEFIQSLSAKTTEILINNSELMNKIRELINSEIKKLPTPNPENPSVSQNPDAANTSTPP